MQRGSQWLAAGALLMGLLGLLSKTFQIDSQLHVWDGLGTVKINGAIGIILTSILWLAQPSGNKYPLFIRMGGVVVLGIGLVTFLEYVLNVDFGIDQLLLTDTDLTNPLAPPGRMSLLTAIDLTLLGLSILAFSFKLFGLGQSLLLLMMTTVYAVLIGYGFEINHYYNFGVYATMSLTTACALLLLGLSGLSYQAEHGFMAILTSPYTGSITARFVYGYCIICSPVLVGIYLYLINQHSFSPAVGMVLVLVVSFLMAFPVFYFIFRRINQLDQERCALTTQLQTANASLSEANQKLQVSIEELSTTNEELLAASEELNAGNEALAKTNEQLQQLREQLEHQVSERTAHLEQTLNELRQRNEELDQYVYKVSHDIRSPVASIAGLLNLLKAEEKPASIQHYLEMIENRIVKLDGFIQSVLMHAKSLNSPVAALPIDFDKIIRQCWEELQFDPGWNRIQLQTTLPAPGLFFSDEVRLLIIFKNLISNAVRYQNPFVESWIKVSVTLEPGHSVIQVADNGLGIEPEYQDKIFDMFFRASLKAEGSGLGLYIVKQVVDRMGGTISVISQVRVGTTFTIRLPNNL